MNGGLKGLVDLETEDEELANLISEYYPERLSDGQKRIIVEEDGSLVYRFQHLSAIYALKFLDNYARDKSYTLVKSSNGRIIKSQKVIIFPGTSLN